MLTPCPPLPPFPWQQPQPDDKDSGTPFNVASAGYEQDAALMEQLRWVGTHSGSLGKLCRQRSARSMARQLNLCCV